LKPKDLYIVAVTGHQAKHLDRYEMGRAYEGIADFLENAKKEHPNLRVLVGGARGIDEIARCECVRLDIPYTLVVPHLLYGETYWSDDYYHWEHMLRVAPKVVYVVPDTEEWRPEFNLRRNDYMLKWCQILLAVAKFDFTEEELKGRGGTRYTVRHALDMKKPVHHIDPRKKETASGTVHDCDRCDAKNIQAARFALTVDRRADGAGGMENVDVVFDLCPRCIAFLLKGFLGQLDYFAAEGWVKANLKKR
jgi:hypothetical protein